MRDENGITFASLVLAIIVLIILASIGVSSGKKTVQSSKFYNVQAQMRSLQSAINSMYSEYELADETKKQEIVLYGQDLNVCDADILLETLDACRNK